MVLGIVILLLHVGSPANTVMTSRVCDALHWFSRPEFGSLSPKIVANTRDLLDQSDRSELSRWSSIIGGISGNTSYHACVHVADHGGTGWGSREGMWSPKLPTNPSPTYVPTYLLPELQASKWFIWNSFWEPRTPNKQSEACMNDSNRWTANIVTDLRGWSGKADPQIVILGSGGQEGEKGLCQPCLARTHNISALEDWFRLGGLRKTWISFMENRRYHANAPYERDLEHDETEGLQ